MAYCQKCGTMVPEGAAACPNCGQAQGSAVTPSAGNAGIASNVAAALAYLWIVAIVWLLIEPYNRDRFVRFHSFQALALGVAGIVVSIFLSLIPIIGWLLLPIVSLLWLVLWLVCVFKAFSNDWFKLPVIGGWSMQQAGPAQ